MNILELFLGQIPEAVFLALFMIFVKSLQKKRVLFIVLLTVSYVLLMDLFAYSWYAHICLTIMIFVTLRVLYEEKSQITDVFILLIAYVLLGVTSAICFVICHGNPVIASIINRVIIFGLLFCFRNKLYKIQVLYKKFWNRNNKPKIIKSATFRSLNIVIFNVIFILLYACMVIATIWKGGMWYGSLEKFLMVI